MSIFVVNQIINDLQIVEVLVAAIPLGQPALYHAQQTDIIRNLLLT